MTSALARVHLRDGGAAPDLLDAFERLRSAPYPWLLDSALPDGRLGRFSFAGADPWAVLRAWGRRIELEVRRPAHPGWAPGNHAWRADPFEALRAVVPEAAGDGAEAVPFVGGAVGYLGYELAEQLERVRFARPAADDGAGLPDLVFLLVDETLALDHRSGRLRLCGLGFGPAASRAAAARSEALARRLASPPSPTPREPVRGPRPVGARHDAGSYGALVGAVKERIAEGDLYQACLTHRLDVAFDGDSWGLYRRLRRANPAPFAAYLALPEGQVLSSSPERFLRASADGDVEARPIKGTRAFRSGSEAGPEAVEASRRELAGSEKDRAENVMIVDLYRNDLGRVCEPGSVRVPELFAVERYAGLHQMVSTVTGRLRPDRDRIDLLRAAFPPGSMTGAPKIAAMRLLAGLEPVRRGVYAGALGHLDVRGGMDLSVVIRTILVANGSAHVHVGGGIVADSQPRAEYQESMDKARPLLEALSAGCAVRGAGAVAPRVSRAAPVAPPEP